jgi:hypothetical protein
LNDAASAASWLRSGLDTQTFTGHVGMATTGTLALSSARITANSSPRERDQLVGYCRELVDPPPPTPAKRLGGRALDTRTTA